ncbi:MAG TPA: arginase family protein [Bacteroidota bacterium]
MKTSNGALGSKQNFLGLDKEHSTSDSSRVIILPVPYGIAGSSRGNGPQAIIQASHRVQRFDEETKRELSKDLGIATLAPLKFTVQKNEAALQLIHETALGILGMNKFLAVLGGGQAITSAVAAAFAKKFDALSVLQFDAHSGLQDVKTGKTYDDASAMVRVCEFLDPKKLVQVGTRAQSREEADFAREHAVKSFYAHEIRGGTHARFLRGWEDAVVECLTEKVYLTFDVDVLDPSIMPATHTPEPNGLSWDEVTRCLRMVGRKINIVGFAFVGFAPIGGLEHPGHTAARLVYKILNYAL